MLCYAKKVNLSLKICKSINKSIFDVMSKVILLLLEVIVLLSGLTLACSKMNSLARSEARLLELYAIRIGAGITMV
jgi:hypothetical protein